MIRVLREDPMRIEADGLLRSVGSDLEACTPLDREVGDRAGAAVLDRLRAFGETPVGAALVTPGGALLAPLLVHVVLRSPDEPISEASVARALRNGLRQAAEWGIGRLVVTPLGMGAGNLDAEASARAMCSVIAEHAALHDVPREVLIPVANPYEEEVFTAAAARASSAG